MKSKLSLEHCSLRVFFLSFGVNIRIKLRFSIIKICSTNGSKCSKYLSFLSLIRCALNDASPWCRRLHQFVIVRMVKVRTLYNSEENE